MMAYAVYYRASTAEQADMTTLMPVFISFGFVIAFLFVLSFIREVVRGIGEAVVVSLTISYWFLVIEKSGSMGFVFFTAAAALGVAAAYVAVRLAMGRETLSPRMKTLCYAWFLFANVLLAYEYYAFLPPGFPLAAGTARPDAETYLRLAVLGMVNVNLVYNFGILYYSTVYSIMNRDARRPIFEQAAALFSDRQVTKREVRKMLLFQSAVFLFFLAAPDWSQFYLLSIWILLTPLTALGLRRIGRLTGRA
jgi:hypothetical protein